jgi:DoxX-like family
MDRRKVAASKRPNWRYSSQASGCAACCATFSLAQRVCIQTWAPSIQRCVRNDRADNASAGLLKAHDDAGRYSRFTSSIERGTLSKRPDGLEFQLLSHRQGAYDRAIELVGIRYVDHREGILMLTAYVVCTALAAGANIFAAINDFTRAEWVLANMTKLGIPHSWLFSLGALKAAGALGLLVGIVTPLIGVAASVGLVLFFVGAIITAVRARWYSHIPYPAGWLLLAVGSLVLRLASL